MNLFANFAGKKETRAMKVLFYFLWGLSSVILLFALLFNHYAEFYLNDYYVDLLFREYSKQWAYINVGITSIWFIFSWIGINLLYNKDDLLSL